MLMTPAFDSVRPAPDASQPDTSATRPTSREILSGVRISDVYRASTSVEPRRTGSDTWRATATWRGGDGYNVSMDDARGVWHDFKTDEGGGVLDLVVRVRGGSRRDAFRWLADFAGFPLDDKPLSAADRTRWARERQELERDLPNARYWKRAAISMAENLLCVLKTALFDPTLPQPDIGEIAHVEAMLAGLHRKDGSALIDEFDWWLRHHAGLTVAMVASAKRLERAQRRALLVYLRETDPRGAAA